MNEHIKFEVKLAGAKFGGEGDAGNDGDGSGNVPVTGDIAGTDGIQIERPDSSPE